MNRIYITILLLSFSFAAVSQPPSTSELKSKAHTFVQNLQYDSALVYYQALAKHYQTKALDDYYLAQVKVAEQLTKLKKYDQAKHLLRHQLKAILNLFNPYIEAKLWQGLANIAYAQTHYKEGAKLCQKAEEAYQNVQGAEIDKLSLQILKADCLSRLASFVEASKLVEKCNIRLQSYDVNIERVAYLQVRLYAVKSFIELGGTLDFSKALETCYTTIKYLRKLPITKQNLYWQAIFLYRKGLLHKNQNRFTLSYKYYHQALELKKQLLGHNHPEIAAILLQIGRLYAKKTSTENSLYRLDNPENPEVNKELDSALTYYNKSLVLYKNIKGNFAKEIGDLYTNLGNLYLVKKSYDQANICFLKAYHTLSKIYGDVHPAMVPLYYYWNLMNCVLRKYDPQLEILHKGLLSNTKNFHNKNIFVAPNVKQHHNPFYFYLFCSAKAMAFANRANDLKDLKASLRYFEAVDSLITYLRKRVVRKQSQLFMSPVFNQTYRGVHGKNVLFTCNELYRRTKQSKYIEKALYFAERNNARLLMRSLAEARAKKFGNIPQKLLNKELELRKKIVHYENQQATNTQDSLVKFNTAYEKLVKILEKKYPKYAQLKLDIKQATIPQLQQKLHPKSAMLLYSIGFFTNNYVFVITKKTAQLVWLPKGHMIQTTLTNYYNQLSNEKRLRTLIPASHQAYNVLLKPAEKYLKGIDKLVIVAPLLENIPFEAMVSQVPANLNQDDFSKPQYINTRYQISYHYSATLWYNTTRESNENHQSHQLDFLAFAPFSTGKSGVFKTVRGKGDYLPESGVEVKSIYNIFKNKHLAAEINLAQAATKKDFIQKVKAAHIVHIASHSEANTKKASLAKIRFATYDQKTGNTSNCLLSGEVYNLELGADLLVLSSCESGVGKFVRGEGVLSLARSFLYAGARNIVFSLWEIDDHYTRELMVTFYKQFLGYSTCYQKALQVARNKMIAQGVHPKHWAGIVMIGK